MTQESNYKPQREALDKVYQWCVLLKIEIIKDRFLYLYCLLTTSAIYALTLYYSFPFQYSVNTYFHTLYLATYSAFLIWCTYYYLYLLYKKEKRPTKRFLLKLKSILLPLHQTVAVILLFLTLGVVFANYTFLKFIIPVINPYEFDHALAELDRVLHLGLDPWLITHYVFSSPWASLLLNTAYNLWFFIMWGVLFFFLIYKRQPVLRFQFLITFLLTWMLLGSVAATLFSSVGPCYLELLTGDQQFTPLMDTLNAQSQYLEGYGGLSLWALNTQNYLWQAYENQQNGLGAGISALPSMHVSIAILVALSLYRLNRTAGYLAYAFAALIQIGSVHLAWHYAVDGYVSIILTVLLWKLVGRFIARFPQWFN
jgi:hypothetical protein